MYHWEVCVSKEYVILKGINTQLSGYATNSQLSNASGYKEYKGLFLNLDYNNTLEGNNDIYSNGYKTTNNKARKGWTLRSFPIKYPSSAIFIDNYFNQGNNNIYDVINKQQIWICNDHAANNNDTRLWFVPPTIEDAETKNRNIIITSFDVVRQVGSGANFYHLELQIEPANR